MSAKYIFRIDDLSWDMEYKRFCRIKELFISYNIKPLIGVIPCNEDLKLKAQAGANGLTKEGFWEEIQYLHHELGWNVALHGFNHVYATSDSGILMINNRSEFSGVKYDVQFEKIRLGKQILEQYGLKVSAFMAPAHSFDFNTIRALQANGINIITDGKTIYTYRKYGVLFVPQLFGRPMKMPFGVYTICLHTNSLNNSDIERIERFLSRNSRDCESFDKAVNSYKTNIYLEFINVGSRILYYGFLRIKRFINKYFTRGASQ